MSEVETVTAAILVIGDEILSGRTKDRNIGHIADHLTSIGIDLKEVRIVPDVEAEIVDAVNELRARYDHVFTTGGIGPTHDDITADSIARAFGVPIGVDPRAVAVMKPYYAAKGIELTEARLRMARIPEGAELIANSVSAAPGFRIGNDVVMAGVPMIMALMLAEVTPLLRTGFRVHSAAIKVFRPEGEIAALFAEHQRELPDVTMGSYPFMHEGKPCAELVLRSRSPERLDDAVHLLRRKLAALGML
mgnify:FL=1